VEFLVLFFGWIIFCHVFATIAPPLITGIGYLIAFLFIAFVEALKLIAKGLALVLLWSAKGAVWLSIRAGRGAALAAEFIIILADEWWRGPGEPEAAEDEPGDGASDDKAGQDARDPYADALACFGLSPRFTQAEFRRAYKQAIRKAHPDVGGSVVQAQAINIARDLIARRHGWK
jgi:hypothetical protein